MAYKFPDDAKTVTFHMILDRPRYITNPLARDCLRDTLMQGLLGNIHQLLCQQITAAHGYRPSCVTYEPVVNHADIQADDIAETHRPGPRQAMHNLIIYRNTDLARILAIP